MKLVLTFVFASCSIRILAQEEDWCAYKWKCIYYDKIVDHTMCTYKDENPVIHDCIDQSSDLTPDSKAMILGLHNYVRNRVASGIVPGWPQAANMRQMTWDDDLAEVALRWAFQCEGGSDQCRKTATFKDVGQNVGRVEAYNDSQIGAITIPFNIPQDVLYDTPRHNWHFDPTKSTNNVFQVFETWIENVAEVPHSFVEKFELNDEYAPFTQIAWANTEKIGCGLVNYQSNETGEYIPAAVLVCNYGPSGNEDGRPMWTKGLPCSVCPESTACSSNSTYRWLCAAPNDPNNEQPVEIDIPTTGLSVCQSPMPIMFLLLLITPMS